MSGFFAVRATTRLSTGPPAWRGAWRSPFIRMTPGLELVLDGINLEQLPVINSGSPSDSELAHLFFGIGTPLVYAPYASRVAEAEPGPTAYSVGSMFERKHRRDANSCRCYSNGTCGTGNGGTRR